LAGGRNTTDKDKFLLQKVRAIRRYGNLSFGAIGLDTPTSK
jgi:hypothetical protein